MSDSTKRETITIDPRAMNVVNRVAAGTRQGGELQCVGGLLVQGRVEGDINVQGGPLIVMPEGEVAGVINCDGEAYIFGKIGPRSESVLSELSVAGVVILAETAAAQANITARSFKMFDGASVEGRMKTHSSKSTERPAAALAEQ